MQIAASYIRDYVYFNRLYAMIHDYFRLYAIVLLQKPKRLYAIMIIALAHKKQLFHLFRSRDYDYFTYFFQHILFLLLRLYTIMCIFFFRKLSGYCTHYLFEMNYCDYFSRANYHRHDVYYAHYRTII